ncbi:MAG: hypothetical protein P8M11_13475, partial [Planctomycetota bacterium]|nr:hypothetical protein [Planctomycetota bacterium]
MNARGWITVVGVLLMASQAAAQLPTLESLLPRGGQRGTEVSLELKGKKLGGALDLMFSGPELELVALEQESAGSVTARVRIAPSAPPGPRWVRLRTSSGITNLLTFSIGVFPHVAEVEPNGRAEEAQALAVSGGGSVTVRGVVELEDRDVFRVEGVAGQRLSVELEAMRLGGRLDAAVSLVDAAGFVLRSCDDVAFARQDPAFSVELPADGPYFIRVRQAAYRGDKDDHYLLHVGAFPRPLSLLPLGGVAGEPLEVELLGEAGSLGSGTVQVPFGGTHGGWVPPGAAAVPVELGGETAPTPCWIRPSPLPNVMESADGSVTSFAAPAALNGRLESERDTDRFSFEVEAGKRYVMEVWARRLRSPLDSVLRLRRDPAKAAVKVNDDAGGGPDSLLEFTAKGGGLVEVEIADQLGRGGPEYTYRVEVTGGTPSIAVMTPRQIKAMAIPRGGRALVMMRVERDGAPGDLKRTMSGLPEKVTAEVIDLPAGTGAWPILLEAAEDAPLAHSELILRAEAPAASGGIMDERRLVEGANRTLFWAQTVRSMALAVTERAPFAVALEVPSVPLPRRGAVDVRVRVQRAEGAKGPVMASLPFLPPGLTSSGQVTIPADKEVGVISLNAGKDARLGAWRLVAVAEMDGPNCRVQAASASASLEVTPPFLTGKAQALSLKGSESGPLLVQVQRREGCPAGGELRVLGLPRGVTADAVPFGPDAAAGASEALVPIRVAEDSPTGKHSGLVVHAIFDLPGGQVVQS